MEDHGFAPGVGVVCFAVVQGASVVKDDRSCRYGAGYGVGQVETFGIGYVVNGALRVVGDVKNAVGVRAGYVTHATVFVCSFVQCDPGGDQIAGGLYTEIALILMLRFGLATGGFEQHLISKDFDAWSNKSAGDIKQFGVFGYGTKDGVKVHEKGECTYTLILCLRAAFVCDCVPFATNGDAFGGLFWVGYDFVCALNNLVEFFEVEEVFDNEISVFVVERFHLVFEHGVLLLMRKLRC